MNTPTQFIKNHFSKAPVPFQLFTKDDFLDIMEQNTKPYRQLMSFYRCAIMEVETKFNVLNEEQSIDSEHNPIEAVKSRIKSVDSLVRKMNRKKISPSVKNIEKHIRDVAGVRVICAFPEDIYRIEKSFLMQDDVKLIERKDYIQNPKPSGYRSLHLIVEVPIFLQREKRMMKVEVQLRTIAMDFWASLEHKLSYKKNLDGEILEELRAELLECSEQSAALDMRMEEIRRKIEAEKDE